MPRPRNPRKYKPGQKFGMLTIIEPGKDAVRPNDGRRYYTYRCRCECGREITVEEPSLAYGRTQSCGRHANAGKYGTKRPNGHRIVKDVCFIKLQDGTEAIVDAEDYPGISKYRWHRNSKHGYVMSGTYGYLRQKQRKPRLIRMHEIVMGRKNIDHINGNPLDNRKANLRPFESFSENAINKPVDSKNKTGYFGVYRRRNGTYCAKLQWKSRQIHLGTFKTSEEAAKARDAEVRKLCGGFGRLNFPEDAQRSLDP